MNAVQLTHRGSKFTARGEGRFAKDVVHDGVWVHPLTGKIIKITPARRENQALNAAKYLKNGNKIPMPDNHTIETAANKGFWPGPFANIGADLFAVAEPLDQKTKDQLSDGSADAVSVNIEYDHPDPEGNRYDEVFTHICLTNYPVVTRQKKFVALSGVVAGATSPYLIKDALAAVAVPEEDEALVDALARFNQTLERAVASEVEDIMLTPAEALAARMMERSLELAQFKGGFDGCVRVQQSKGLSAESARKLCAYIGRRAGKIK